MKKTILDYFAVLFGTILARGVAFINSIIIARLLGPEDFGRFSIFFIVMVLTWVFPQAFDNVFIRFSKLANSLSEKNDYLSNIIVLKFIYGIIVGVFSYPIALLLAQYCFHQAEMTLALMAALISGVFQSYLMTVASIFQEKEKFLKFSLVYSSYTLCLLSALVAMSLIPSAFTYKNVIFVHLLVSVFMGIASIYLIWLKKLRHKNLFDKQKFKLIAHIGKWAFGTQVLWFIYQRLDTVFVARNLAFEDVGLYAAAQQLILIVSVLTGSLASILLPKACKALESQARMSSFSKEMIFLTLAINVAVIALWALAPWLAGQLYGSSYSQAGTIIRILLVGWAIAIFCIPLTSIIDALGAMKIRFMIESGRLILTISCLSSIVSDYGIQGTAWAMSVISAIFGAAIFIVCFYQVRRHFQSWSHAT